jgi:hypothetical protein
LRHLAETRLPQSGSASVGARKNPKGDGDYVADSCQFSVAGCQFLLPQSGSPLTLTVTREQNWQLKTDN